MNVLFLFLDGVGLGLDDPLRNPFARAEMPNLQNLLAGNKLLATTAPFEGKRATLLALDARLSVDGRPQSATGQAAILTGKNAPALLGYHYGPKPNPEVIHLVKNGNLFSALHKAGKTAVLLNAYPPQYFENIQNGRRLPGVLSLAASSAGLKLKTLQDLIHGTALSVDFTGHGWRDYLGISETPLLDPTEAGQRLGCLTQEYDFTCFEFWPSDVAGHRQDMTNAIHMLAQFDQVLGGLLPTLDEDNGLIILTSDHGNVEDLSHRHHTYNPVPLLLIGSVYHRQRMTPQLKDLTDIAPAILELFSLTHTEGHLHDQT
ncbi:MAG: sulfatase-like hydrolase/transferase [Chloroflexota bacterium]